MIRGELDNLRSAGLTEEEVAEAVAHIHGQDTVAADDTETRMRTLARQWMRFGRAEPYETLCRGILRVDPDRVRSARDLVFRGSSGVLAYGRIGARIRNALGAAGNGE
jgi:predicted Zn-dependent peptidase